MRKWWISCALVVLLVNPEFSAADPPSSHQAALPWLALARRDIAALPAEVNDDFVLLKPSELAMLLYQTAPCEEARLFALQKGDQYVESFQTKATSAEETKMALQAKAHLHAVLKDPDSARRLLAEAEKTSNAPPTTNPQVQFAASYSDWVVAETDLLIGDQAAFEKVKLMPMGYSMLSRMLKIDGYPELAKTVLEFSQKKQKETPQPDSSESSSQGLERLSRARELAQNGQITEARKLAATADDGLPENETKNLPPGYYQFHSFIAVGNTVADGGDLKDAASDLKSAEAIFEKFPAQVTDADRLSELLNLAARVKKVDAFKHHVTELKALCGTRSVVDGRSPQVSAIAKMAKLAAGLGDRADYQWAIDEAERRTAKPADPHYLSTDDAARQTEARVENYLSIAIARAAMGDVAGVNADIQASRQAGQIKQYMWDESVVDIGQAYADRGMFKEAMSTIDLESKDGAAYGSVQAYVAERELQTGRFDEAWAMTERVPARRRIQLEYQLTVQQVQAGQESKMQARVAATKSPSERAMIELAVAQALEGQAYVGEFVIFKPRNN